jgi:hypothetical protein
MHLPAVPTLEDENTYKAVSALAGAASMLQTVLYRVVSGENFDDLMAEHGAMIFLSDAVVAHWQAHFDSKDATKH